MLTLIVAGFFPATTRKDAQPPATTRNFFGMKTFDRFSLKSGKQKAEIHLLTLADQRTDPADQGPRGRKLLSRASWAEVVRSVEEARGQKWAQLAGRHGDPGLALALGIGRRCTGMTQREILRAKTMEESFRANLISQSENWQGAKRLRAFIACLLLSPEKEG